MQLGRVAYQAMELVIDLQGGHIPATERFWDADGTEVRA